MGEEWGYKMSQDRLYKVEACLITAGYFGEFVIAGSKKQAIQKMRERYKHYMIVEYRAKSLGEWREPIK